jgi:hypothetical protein
MGPPILDKKEVCSTNAIGNPTETAKRIRDFLIKYRETGFMSLNNNNKSKEDVQKVVSDYKQTWKDTGTTTAECMKFIIEAYMLIGTVKQNEMSMLIFDNTCDDPNASTPSINKKEICELFKTAVGSKNTSLEVAKRLSEFLQNKGYSQTGFKSLNGQFVSALSVQYYIVGLKRNLNDGMTDDSIGSFVIEVNKIIGTTKPNANDPKIFDHMCLSADSLPAFDCVPGTYKKKNTSQKGFKCTICPAGTYSDTPDASECKPCKAGTSYPNKGATSEEECGSCPINTFSSEVGQPYCKMCAKGFHAPYIGSTGCTELPFNKCNQGYTASNASNKQRFWCLKNK